MTFPAGSVLVFRRGDIVDELLEVPAAPGEHWRLRSLYLGKQYVTEWSTPDIGGARLATPADHERARWYAASFTDGAELVPVRGQLELFGRVA